MESRIDPLRRAAMLRAECRIAALITGLSAIVLGFVIVDNTRLFAWWSAQVGTHVSGGDWFAFASHFLLPLAAVLLAALLTYLRKPGTAMFFAILGVLFCGVLWIGMRA